MKSLPLISLTLAVSFSLSILSACSSSSDSAADDTNVISGAIVAAPVNGAEVRAEDINGNLVAGPVSTNAAGQYSFNISDEDLGKDLLIKSTGGSFTDEATGNEGIAGEMLSYIAANTLSDGTDVCATPGSTIIAQLVMNHNKTMTEAQNVFQNAFGYTPDVSIIPADATGPDADSSEAAKLSGFRAAAFSQLAMDLGLSHNDQFEMFLALAKDLSDDVLDGVDDSGAVAIGATGFSLQANIQNRFSTALVNFKNSGYNMTGLNNAQIGNLPFNKVAFTYVDPTIPDPVSTYKVEYIQIGMMEAMAGKSSFTIRVTEHNGAPYTGATPTLLPTMYMSSMNHSTPMPTTAIVPTNPGSDDGEYTVTLYYLMASQMMDGMSMGFWDLKFTVANGEFAHLYPTVMMAMGDTLQVSLKGVDDKVMAMTGGMEGRTYYIFNDGLDTGSGMGLYDFSVFIAATENMISYPALVDAAVLNSGQANELTVDTANTVVRVSANQGPWSDPLVTSNGVWSISDLALNAGENQVRVSLTVNSEVKTTDGLTEEVGVNDYQTFTITPGSM